MPPLNTLRPHGDMMQYRGTNAAHKEHEEQRSLIPDSSKDLQAPSGDSIVSLLNCTAVAGLIQRLAPATMAASHWPVRMASRAWSRASKLEEQAVSTVKLGPIKLQQP